MFVYLIGPSGAGKSTIAAGVVLQRSVIRHVDLDAVVKAKDWKLYCHNGDRWGEFWALTLRCLEELKRGFEGISLIDCGAGCLQTNDALSFFKSQSSVIAFTGSQIALFERAKRAKPYWMNRSFEEYQRSEFSEHRKKFYDTAKFKLDAGANVEKDAVDQVLSMLVKMEGSGDTSPNSS